ncbi:Mss4-like protein [Xylariaceae sp. FL1651]|nr:Mss4-like protein [Xylariaceae sp. FL1651]
MPGSQGTRTFDARCHCGNISYAISIPAPALPLNAYICGCATCRHTHGTFGAFYVLLPKGIAPHWANADASLIAYNTRKDDQGGHGELNFCAACGAHFGFHESSTSQWTLDISLFDEPFWVFTDFLALDSSLDGGMLPWLPQCSDKEVSQRNLITDKASDLEPEVGVEGEERLRAQCHCGGVSFTIPRPTPAVENDEYMRDYVSPKDPKKWKAFLDFCHDCRLLSSAHFTPWILVPRFLVEPVLSVDLRLGTMKTYASSARNTRGFCGRCGATVLIKTQDRTPTDQQTVLNIAMGILRAPEGVRAESWVTWRAGKPAWVDDAKGYDAYFSDSVIDGHKRWSVDSHGEALVFDVI